MISTCRAALGNVAYRKSAPQFGGHVLTIPVKPKNSTQTNPPATIEQQLDDLSEKVAHLQNGQQFFFDMFPSIDEQFDKLFDNQTSTLSTLANVEANQVLMMELLIDATTKSNLANPSTTSTHTLDCQA